MRDERPDVVRFIARVEIPEAGADIAENRLLQALGPFKDASISRTEYADRGDHLIHLRRKKVR